MALKFNRESFDLFVKKLTKEYRVFAPKTMERKGKFSDTNVVGYCEVNNGSEINFIEKSYFSPKEIFYPIRETLFNFINQEAVVPEIDIKPIVIFLRPCDLNGIERLDTIFLNNGDYADFYYARRRELVKFVVIECTEGYDNCYCVSMGSNVAENYDGIIRISKDEIVFESDELEKFADKIDSEKANLELQFIKANKIIVNIPAVESITQEVFNHPLWTEYTRRCIACGRCNTSCITCSCFTMQDVYTDNNKVMSERRRRWAGCHVDGFSDMAGGHSFRGKNGERMRFKTMHKINDFHKRFGKHMCIGCGRCDDVCPEYISFSKCINTLNTIIEGEGKNE